MKKSVKLLVLCAFVIAQLLSFCSIGSYACDEPTVGSSIKLEDIDVSAVPQSVNKAIQIGKALLTKRAKTEWLLTEENFSEFSSSKDEGKSVLRDFLGLAESMGEYRSYIGTEIENFSVSYSLTDYDVSKNKIVITLYESIDFNYVGKDFSSGLDNLFVITFDTSGDNYEITDISTPWDWNLFSQVKNKNTNFDLYTSELKSDYDRIEENTSSISVGIDESSARGTVNTIRIPYRKDLAAQYARVYSRTGDTSIYNDSFDYISGSDCANFVSQCVWAGFGGDNSRANSRVYPYDFDGSVSMCTTWNRFYSGDGYGSYPWNSAIALGYYVTYSASNSPSSEDGWEFVQGVVADPDGSQNAFPAGNDYLGAVLFVQGSSVEYGHVVMVTIANSNDIDDIFVSGHTSPMKNVRLSETNYIYYRIKYVIPTYFKVNTECSGSYTTHNYLGTSNGYCSTCTRCGYINMYMNLGWSDVVTGNKLNVNISEKHGNAPRSITAQVYSPSNTLVGTYRVTDSSELNVHTPILTELGLYRIVVTVLDTTDSCGTTRSYEYEARVRQSNQ